MEEIDLRDLLRVFWIKKIQVIIIIAVFFIIGLIYTMKFVTPVYTSETKLLLATSNNTDSTLMNDSISTTDITINAKLVSTYSELVGSKNIIRKVISNLGIDISENEIKKNTTVTAVKNTEVIQISVKNENPILAEMITNEIAKVFIDMVKEYYKIDNIHIVDKAEVSEIPSNINHKKDIALFSGAGVVVAFIYVLLINMFDTTIKSEEDIENIYKLPVLASIPIYEEPTNRRKKGGHK